MLPPSALNASKQPPTIHFKQPESRRSPNDINCITWGLGWLGVTSRQSRTAEPAMHYSSVFLEVHRVSEKKKNLHGLRD